MENKKLFAVQLLGTKKEKYLVRNYIYKQNLFTRNLDYCHVFKSEQSLKNAMHFLEVRGYRCEAIPVELY
jgi:hypothetical protein